MNNVIKKSNQEKAAIFLCASLASETKRQRRFANNFKDKSQFHFVNSIDGRKWSELDVDGYCSAEMMQRRKSLRLKAESWLGPAAIACALTHRDRLLSRAEENTLILCEDDIILNPDFIDLWCRDDIREQFQKFDGPVLFHYFSQGLITASSPPVASFGKYSIYRLDQVHILSSACYFVSKEVAYSIRQHQTPIRSSADAWAEMKKHGVFKEIYVVHPSPCQIAGFATTLGYEGSLRSNNFFVILARRLNRLMHRRVKKLYETVKIRS